MTREPLRIQPYSPEDLDAVIRVWRLATVVGHPFQGEGELDRDEVLIRNEYMKQTRTWCAWRAKSLAGFVSLVETCIVALFVEPSQHRLGVGSALLRHVNAQKGPLSVEVFAANRVAMPFYERHGFAFVREHPNPMYPGQTQWLMAQSGAGVAAVPNR